ncbi:MAG: hypothetical protein RR448_07000 [Niameybacter sp.]|uniref:hypothetical protein n=1 Tax=Niameybacter sp. TaxID=2033640 RepID=UPI002FC871C7
MKRQFRGKICAFMMGALCMVPHLYAVPPKPLIDETLYVNLDAYGELELANVVKTYTLNGHTQIQDYGDYTQVTNMTDFTKPEVEANHVIWQLPNDLKRFYFEGTIEKVELPWHFDITYLLNGVPKTVEEIAGASGYVEILIQATPNEKAHVYYKNNLLLQVAATFNMDETESLRAEGAQIQAIGNTKMVMFVAMPGESVTFKIGVGTQNFTTGGITMMMVPATLSQFDKVKGIGEKTQEIELAAQAMNTGLDAFLGSLDQIQASLVETSEGLKQFELGLEASQSSGDAIGENHVVIMDELGNLLGTMEGSLPELQTIQPFVEQLYTHGNAMMDVIKRSGKDLKQLREALFTLEDTLRAVALLGEDLSGLEDKQEALIQQLQKDLNTAQTAIQNVHNQFYALGDSLATSQATLDQLNSLIGSSALNEISHVLGDASATLNGLAKLMGSMDALVQNMDSVGALIGEYSNILAHYKEAGQEGLDSLQSLVGEMSDLVGRIVKLQEEMLLVQETMESYKVNLLNLITQIEKLATHFTTLLQQSIQQVETVENEMTMLAPYMTEGMRQTLSGMQHTLARLTDGLEQLGTIKASKDTIAHIVSGEWNTLTKEMNLLKIDPDAPIVSITSTDNPPPDTLQIMVRTAEVMPTESLSSPVDLEPETEKVSLWERIVNIFQSIWNGIKRLF